MNKTAVPASSRLEAGSEEIREFIRSLARLADPDVLLRRIGERFRELFAADLAVVLMADPGGRDFTPLVSFGFSPEALNGIGFSSRGRLADWLGCNKRCLSLFERLGVKELLDPIEWELLRGLKIQICAPLVSLDRLIGMILLGSNDPVWALSSEESDLLDTLASQASLALENAVLHLQQRQQLSRLYLAERLAAAGQLAAGVAHEIRNPLTVVSSTVEYLAREFPADDPKRALAEQLLSEVGRIARTTESLIWLGREREPQQTEIDLLEVIEQVLLLVEVPRRQQHVEIVKSYDLDRFTVFGDFNEIKQVFFNLMLNSLQAMESGTISVRVGTRISPYNPLADLRVEVELTDTGRGIHPEDLARVFDPFFTTKREGTGLGLYICQSILARYDGEIGLESRIDQGTTVRVHLPLLD